MSLIYRIVIQILPLIYNRDVRFLSLCSVPIRFQNSLSALSEHLNHYTLAWAADRQSIAGLCSFIILSSIDSRRVKLG